MSEVEKDKATALYLKEKEIKKLKEQVEELKEKVSILEDRLDAANRQLQDKIQEFDERQK